LKIQRTRLPLTLTTVVGLLASPAWADDASEVPAAPPAAARAPARDAPLPAPEQTQTPDQTALHHRLFVHESFGFNVLTYTAASGKVAASTTTPGDKVILYQQVGIGYWVHPNIRLQLTGILGETVSGLKPGASSFTMGGVIPCAFYTNGGFFAGGGPLLAPRAFGANAFNIGIFSLVGYAFALGHGLTLAGAVQAPVMLEQKESVAVTPAIILGERI
jgi:hypothetical protein